MHRGWKTSNLRYMGVSKEIVHILMHQGYTRVGERLAAPLMIDAHESQDRPGNDVQVPLHRSRLMHWGCNQAELLARAVATERNAPISDTILVVRMTRDQVALSATESRANVLVASEPKTVTEVGFSWSTTCSLPARR